jgi:hypothetical protein
MNARSAVSSNEENKLESSTTPELTEEEAFRILAAKILKSGESTHPGNYCLLPRSVDDPKADSLSQASVLLFHKYKATHFDVYWAGAADVKVELYAADCFGAALHVGPVVKSHVVPKLVTTDSAVQVCTWTPDQRYRGVYNTQCGATFSAACDSVPSDQNVHFCPNCGCRLQEEE